jgi:hypothetical protein
MPTPSSVRIRAEAVEALAVESCPVERLGVITAMTRRASWVVPLPIPAM